MGKEGEGWKVAMTTLMFERGLLVGRRAVVYDGQH